MTRTYGIAFKAALLASASLGFSAAAFAQATKPSDDQIESIVVSGTRISRPGFSAPTPVTAVSAADLTAAAPTDVADVLNQLPQFGSGTGSRTGFQGGGNAGANYVNLRNLGLTRTLVLLNGERVVSSALTNQVDLNTLPQTLLQHVDIVTGGASAAWGSDAVAGVVNLVLNNNFTGLKASAQYGNNSIANYEAYNADISVGTTFDGDRGHVSGTMSYFNNPNIALIKQAPWNTYTMLMLNPAYVAGGSAPHYLITPNVGLAQATSGGLITAGPLKNTQFVGPTGIPTAYNPGLVSGTIGYGGDNDRTILNNNSYALAQLGFNFYVYGSYRIAPNLIAHVSLDDGYDSGTSTINPYLHNANITITADNPFIPAQTVAAMTAAKITSFQFGSLTDKIGNIKDGGGIYITHRTQQRASVGLDGTIGDGWSWKAYYEHGENHNIERWFNDPFIPNFNAAVDAVTVTAANVGTSGLALGSAACRSTLTNPTNGCKPLNLFGTQRAPDDVINYIQPVQFYQINNKQDVAEASFQGDPVDDWAGPISLAGGVGYRSESAGAVPDSYSLQRTSYVGNSQPFHGAVNVYEGFAELVVPVAKDEFWAKSMDLNLAGRITDYSTSGVVESWKLGLTNQVSDEYRLRATWSADIRAPNLSELFTAASSGGRVVTDPFTSICAPTTCAALVLNTNTGNRNLVPENASTVSGGIVFTPDWLEGFSMSLDWYSINIKGAIASISQENELAYCYAGQTNFCPLIHRNAAGTITEIVASPQNTAAQTNSGLDIEAEYTRDLWSGNLDTRFLGNYTDETTLTQNGNTISNAGSIGPNTLGGAGRPKFRGTVTATYNLAPYSVTAQTRLISSALQNNKWGPGDINNNDVPWIVYFDLRGSYDFADHWQVFGAMDNVFDTPPPLTPYLYSQSGQIYRPQSDGTLYDLLGREYRLGLRVTF